MTTFNIMKAISYLLYYSGVLHFVLRRINKKKITSERFHQLMVKIYTSTNGVIYEKLFNDLEKLPKDKIEKLKLELIEKFNILFDEGILDGSVLDNEILDHLLETYNKDGYVVLPFKLEKNSCQNIIDEISKKPGVYRDCFDGQRIKEVNSLDIKEPGGILAQVDLFKHSTTVIDRILEVNIFGTLASYLMQSKRALLNIATVWWSFPSLKASSEAAQKYHFDLDGLKWGKIFIYLTDVTENNGPHTAVMGTHVPGKKDNAILKRGYVRVEDDEVEFGKERKFVGKSGTIIIGDTKCWHKGSFVKENNRAIFQLEYTCHPLSSSIQ